MFITLACLPLAAARWSGVEPAGALQELATGLGMLAAALIFLQFLSSGRYEFLSARLGIDWTMGFHRISAVALLALAVLHPLAYVLATAVADPDAAWSRLSMMVSSPRLRSGLIALIGIAGLILFAVFREHWKVRYETWRATHGILAITIAALVLHHAVTAGTYSAEKPVALAWALLALLALAAIATVYVLRPWRMERGKWFATRAVASGSGNWEIALRGPEKTRFNFEPGQFVWISVAPHRPPFHDHPFSIASSPADLPELRLIVRESGDCTCTFGSIAVGTPVALDGPHGSFVVDADASRLLFVAGGVGIAPILGILEHAARVRDQRRFRLLYLSRNEATFAGLDRLQKLQSEIDLDIRLLSDEQSSSPHVTCGPLNASHIADAAGDPASLACYVCGPPPMMTSVTDALLDLGVAPAAIHYERFDYSGGSGRMDRARRNRAAALLSILLVALALFSAL
jgi:predicted ferric reductase